MKILDFVDDDELMEEVKDNSFIPMLKTEDEADEALAKIIWARKKIAGNEVKVKKKKEELQKLLADYEKRLNKSLESYLSYQSSLLKGYIESQDSKTLKLFHGNVRIKKPAESLSIDDENSLLLWLKETGCKSCIKTKETISKTELKKTFKKDPSGDFLVDSAGNVIHGAHFERGEESLQITEAKGA